MYHIEQLKKIMKEGYEVYTFKSKWRLDQFYFDYLKNEHGIILKDYSKTFCKLELTKSVDEIEINAKADSICYR